MKAIRVATHGGPEVLRPEEVPDPVPGKGEVLIRIAAAGVNFYEVYQRTGQYPAPTLFIPGSEASGVVESVGPGVTDVKYGDRVASVNVRGAYAELAIVPADRLVMLHEGRPVQDLPAALAWLLREPKASGEGDGDVWLVGIP